MFWSCKLRSVLLFQVYLCHTCHNSLRRDKANNIMLPPALAICNNWASSYFWIKSDPRWTYCYIESSSWNLICSTGKNMLQLRSHTPMIFLNERMPICLVPPNIAPDDFYVMFAWLDTSEIEIFKNSKKIYISFYKTTGELVIEYLLFQQLCRCFFRHYTISFLFTLIHVDRKKGIRIQLTLTELNTGRAEFLEWRGDSLIKSVANAAAKILQQILLVWKFICTNHVLNSMQFWSLFILIVISTLLFLS